MRHQDWRVLGAAVRGTSHQRRSQPCQDAWQATVRDDGVLLAAVADGAGSASRSHDGAREAVSAAIAALTETTFPDWHADPPEPDPPEPEIPEPEGAKLADSDLSLREDPPTPDSPAESPIAALLRDVLHRAKSAVCDYAEAESIPVRELASTLILLVATRNGVAVAQIGDGAAVMADETGTLKALTQPQQGEYANQTTFLTSEGAIARAQVNVLAQVPQAIALFSDGLQRLALEMPQGTPHDRFFAPLFQFVAQDLEPDAGTAQLESFLQSPRVTQRSDDDLTLLLASVVS